MTTLTRNTSHLPLIITPEPTYDASPPTTPRQPPPTSSSPKSNHTTTLLVLTAGLSGLLFGYDTGIISSTLLHLPASFPLTTLSKSLITSSTSLFALLASPLSSPLSDTLGRRPVILLSCLLFVLGAALQALAWNVAVMVAGRSVVGLAVGAASTTVPLYIGEIAPAEKRGRMVTVQSLFITGGQVVAYLVGWGTGTQWRVAVGLGAVPALAQVGLMGWLVESPRFLVMRGREAEAGSVLGRLEGVQGVEEVVGRIREEVEMMGKGGTRGAARELWRVGGNRRALVIACLLQGLQQLCGFNVLMYFSATIFDLVGFSSPVMTSLSIAITNFLFTLAAFSLIDAIGRRRILLISIPFMFIGLALCAICFVYLPQDQNTHAGKAETLRLLLFKRESHARTLEGWSLSVLPMALLVSLILYVAAYALGLGCVPWQQSELFPLQVRSLGSGLATATNWSSNFLVGITFLPMMEALGSGTTFAVYAVICFLGWFLVYNFYPETAGLELEDVGQLLADGWGVKSSMRPGRADGHVIVPQEDPDAER
ncbi:Myo-inositol transporter-like protein 6 [Elsinoe australis]|uniref:Myo-inositol transporter-like protein 6 n=1 Tax=Elsinoe australis TaxID=40998 RepID=A0A4U7ASU8_9PEZI|nr:Myo-inositol transporter-like protein 6 [Elsinoe australis]